ncbi:phage tail assembly chaperone [Gorillibacterium sp. sgz5001074]|uniref:phage tail assembly chaperone n=1 Tax=Gorillibacterium sp. sgz5001074 TaxID=3446695 RepID=UPI003F666559
MSDTLKMLLGLNPETLTRPTKRVEIPRLSRLANEKVELTIQALTFDEESEILEISGEDAPARRMHTVLKGVAAPNLKDKALLEKYGAATPKQLLERLFLPGELLQLYNQIADLGGYGEDAVIEVKNE